MLVLDSGNGVVENFRTLLVGHQDTALDGKAAGELAVIGIDLRHHIGAIGFQRADFRQVACVNEKKTASRAQRNRTKQEKRERNAVNQFPAA